MPKPVAPHTSHNPGHLQQTMPRQPSSSALVPPSPCPPARPCRWRSWRTAGWTPPSDRPESCPRQWRTAGAVGRAVEGRGMSELGARRCRRMLMHARGKASMPACSRARPCIHAATPCAPSGHPPQSAHLHEARERGQHVDGRVHLAVVQLAVHIHLWPGGVHPRVGVRREQSLRIQQ